MEDFAPMMRKGHQNEEHLESRRGYDEEIDGYEIFDMVFQKCPPGRGGRMARADTVLVHC
jgi:hypothetical protein